MRASEKIITLPVLILITLSMTGVAFAHWSDEIYVEGTVEMGSCTLAFDWFEPPICTEFHEEYPGGPLVIGELCGKDVGHTECWYEDVIEDPHTEKWGYETMVVEIHNAYPCYRVHCVFVVRNIGTIPITIMGYTATDPDGMLTWDPDLEALVDDEGNPVIHIWHTNLVGEQIDPCNTEKAEFDFHIAQDAEECHTYRFEIELVYNQWEHLD